MAVEHVAQRESSLRQVDGHRGVALLGIADDDVEAFVERVVALEIILDFGINALLALGRSSSIG